MSGISDIYAQQVLQSGTVIRNAEISRHRDSVTVSMQMDVTDTRIKSGGSLILAPRLSGADGKGSAYVPPVELMGRKRRIYLQRNPETAYTSDEMYRVIEKKRKEKQLVEYTVTVPYASWMEHSRLQIVEDLCGCGKVESGNLNELAQADLSFRPRLAYVVPEAEPVKARELSGKAFLDFRVNRTEIDPSYRQNPVELKRILASIDTVKNDRDFTVTEITIKGYASPEGSYAVNKRLAEGRTEALKKYIVDRYGFDKSVIRVESEPENWQGLVEYVSASSLSDKEQILDFIENGPSDIDQKEKQMRTKFPASYSVLLNDCYPGLRRTDYRIDYVIRRFRLEEAKALVKTAPQRLSLEEMFAVAQTYEPGSEDFNQVFDVAVRMYPDDETANINAANALLEQGRAEEALKYLDKVKDSSPEAANARGVAYILLKDYEKAGRYIGKALEGHLEEAAHNMEFLK
jgi:outer membrane protein OmpA-like peptidoglycan-associated protein